MAGNYMLLKESRCKTYKKNFRWGPMANRNGGSVQRAGSKSESCKKQHKKLSISKRWINEKSTASMNEVNCLRQ